MREQAEKVKSDSMTLKHSSENNLNNKNNGNNNNRTNGSLTNSSTNVNNGDVKSENQPIPVDTKVRNLNSFFILRNFFVFQLLEELEEYQKLCEYRKEKIKKLEDENEKIIDDVHHYKKEVIFFFFFFGKFFFFSHR